MFVNLFQVYTISYYFNQSVSHYKCIQFQQHCDNTENAQNIRMHIKSTYVCIMLLKSWLVMQQFVNHSPSSGAHII